MLGSPRSQRPYLQFHDQNFIFTVELGLRIAENTIRRRYCAPYNGFCYRGLYTVSSGREGLETSFAYLLPSRREYVVGQAV